MARVTLLAASVLMIQLASCASAEEIQDLTTRQNTKPASFSGTADAIEDYDPHDYVPNHYSKVRIAHAVTMSVVWLVILPLGGIIPRVMRDSRFVWVHAIMQMIGFWLNVAATAMGIWMAKEINQLNYYHPMIGLILLGLLAIQPATEILNHKFYHAHPRMIISAHIHLWLGRSLLIAGAIQGGLGFLFAASFRKANVETWPRILYAGTALVVWVIYILVGILYPEFRGRIKAKIGHTGTGNRTQVVAAGEMENLRVRSVGSGQHARGPSSAPLMNSGASAFGGYQVNGNAYPGNGYQGNMYPGNGYQGNGNGSVYAGNGYQGSVYAGSMYQER